MFCMYVFLVLIQRNILIVITGSSPLPVGVNNPEFVALCNDVMFEEDIQEYNKQECFISKYGNQNIGYYENKIVLKDINLNDGGLLILQLLIHQRF